MTKRRELFMTDAAIRARDQRLTARIRADEAWWNTKIRKLMDGGLGFDEAWIAAGGQIIPIVFHDQEREVDAA